MSRLIWRIPLFHLYFSNKRSISHFDNGLREEDVRVLPVQAVGNYDAAEGMKQLGGILTPTVGWLLKSDERLSELKDMKRDLHIVYWLPSHFPAQLSSLLPLRWPNLKTSLQSSIYHYFVASIHTKERSSVTTMESIYPAHFAGAPTNGWAS